MVAWQIALDVVQDVRGSIAMYLFIIEEALQTLGMACYLYQKANMKESVRNLAKWAIDNVVDPAIEFNNTYGAAAYPLNMAYDTFYHSSRISFQTYIHITEKK